MQPPGAPVGRGPRVWLAGGDEADTVAGLLIEFRDWWGRDWPSEDVFRAGVRRLIERADSEFLLGAPHDDAPAGGVCQLRFRYGIWLAAEDCWLEDLFVRADARGTGLGDALVEHALDRARTRGCRRIELDVNSANQAARRLYERHGFSSFSDPPGGDDLLMRLRLG